MQFSTSSHTTLTLAFTIWGTRGIMGWRCPEEVRVRQVPGQAGWSGRLVAGTGLGLGLWGSSQAWGEAPTEASPGYFSPGSCLAAAGQVPPRWGGRAHCCLQGPSLPWEVRPTAGRLRAAAGPSWVSACRSSQCVAQLGKRNVMVLHNS